MLLSSPCHADSNMDFGSSCSGSDNSTMDGEYQSNLLILLKSLAANGPIENGFYKTTVGKGHNKIYGLAQCRGDISAMDCAACIKNATMAREISCSDSVMVTMWFKWCSLRYSNLKFFGEWDGFSLGLSTNATIEDPEISAREIVANGWIFYGRVSVPQEIREDGGLLRPVVACNTKTTNFTSTFQSRQMKVPQDTQHINPCHADTNENFGSQCSDPDNATDNSEYQANLNDLLNSLAANGPIRNGFYTTTAGKGADKIFGLTQCRGDISATDCASCIKNATMVQGCSESKRAKLWFNWCFLRYSNRSFFGEWDQSGMAAYNDTKFEDPKVVSEGLNFTKALASTTPNQPLMFLTAVLDVGQNGKRYGVAQCTRDLSRSYCGKCLDFQLVTYKNSIGSKRSWDTYGSSCSMRYHDYQFYFNISTPAKGGSARSSPAAIGMVFPVLVFLLVF
ncbi:unnamed protein product [Dovyalis caffra]|uniref:Gnk2-homologous domain-containing protein n=1 Tax=Dovyalis caffra TaxID=77055 RepID=A0AAV1SHA0_9ROSI|nr:unnamed protein product [Dovyalis caffra]